jgi:hypothetical protein
MSSMVAFLSGHVQSVCVQGFYVCVRWTDWVSASVQDLRISYLILLV